MTLQYLSTRRYIAGLFFTIIDSFFVRPQDHTVSSYLQYKLVTPLTLFGDRQKSYFTGVYQDQSGRHVMIRNLAYVFKTLKYYQIVHEAAMLSSLSSRGPVYFPQLLEVHDEKGKLVLVRKYIEGTPLQSFPTHYKTTVLKHCLDTLRNLPIYDGNVPPVRTKQQQFFLLFIYSIILLLKDPQHGRLYVRLFVTCLLRFDFSAGHYCIAHRDLHPHNIILDTKKRIYIIDSEVMVLAEIDTDLAIVTRRYYKEFGGKGICGLLHRYIKTEEEKDRYLRLTIFYTFQLLVQKKREEVGFMDACDYLYFIKDL